MTVRSITTQHDQDLYLSGEEADKIRGKRVLIVDDVISTGESLHAMEELVEKAGGTVAGRMAVLAEGDAQNRKDIVYLGKLPVFNPRRHRQSLIHNNIVPPAAALQQPRFFALPRLPFRGPIPPYQGKCPEGTKGKGCWLGAAETERLSQICIEKPKPQIQFAVWKGRNEHRG